MRILKLFLLFIPLFLFVECSEDENTEQPHESQEIIIDGGEVFLNKVVLIDKEGVVNETYGATFNDTPVEVLKITDSQIGFIITPDVANINELNTLKIPSLNITATYTVLPITLEGTPTETLQPFITKINNIDTSTVNQGNNIQAFLDNFNQYYSNLSDSEIQTMAEFYYANRELFENYLNINGRSINDILANLGKCDTYTYATGAFGVLAAATVTNLQVISILCSAAGVVSFYHAIDVCGTFAEESVKNFSVTANNTIYGTNSRSAQNNDIVLYNNEYKNIPFSVGMRPINSSDENDANQHISTFFKAINFVNSIITEKINVAISYYNNNVPSLLEITPFNVINISDNNASSDIQITQELLNNFSFSIGSELVTLDAVEVDSDGILKVKASIEDVNNIPDNGLETTLDFVYTDDFNSTEGSLPIILEKLNILGTWNIEGSDSCQNTNGTNFTDNYADVIVFNENGTITVNNDSGGVYNTNNYTFDGENLSINLNYNDYTGIDNGFTCEGQDYQVITESWNFTYNYNDQKFYGTGTTNAQELEEEGICNVIGRFCNNSAQLYR